MGSQRIRLIVVSAFTTAIPMPFEERGENRWYSVDITQDLKDSGEMILL